MSTRDSLTTSAGIGVAKFLQGTVERKPASTCFPPMECWVLERYGAGAP